MKSLTRSFFFLFATLLASLAVPLHATHMLEYLDRGVVAVRTNTTDVYVSWRMLGTDSNGVSFNLYRSTGGGAAALLNGAPITGATLFTDSTADLAQSNAYFVRPVLSGVEQAASISYTLPAGAPIQQYLRVPLQRPAGGSVPDGGTYTYSPNDCTVADLDGDGEYEIVVKWDPSNAQDNANDGYTGNVLIDGYKMDGTRLWRVDLGRNIRAGAHYTQFLVYDFDGDGKAELVCKTAPNTSDSSGTFIGGAGKFLGVPSAPIDHNADYRNAFGYIRLGPEFFTIFNGLTGAEIVTTNYVVPRNNNPASDNVTAWGDDYGNRVDRFLACVAYLDGQRPSIVLCRGYYTRAVLAAWDFRGGQLTQRWVFDTGNEGTASPLAAWRGQGAHSLTVGDVDGDGRDEITYGAAAIDDDGTGLYSTLLGHGDALHMSDMDPSRPGQEVWMVHESPGSYGPNGLEFRDARTGQLIFGVSGAGADVGRGVAGDIDPRFLGYEMWGARGGLMAANGTQITASRPGQMNFMIWWDGDLLREILDGTTITKWNWLTSTGSAMLAPSGVSSNNGTKANPALSADIFGDWREEVVFRESTNDALRIYTTTIPTTTRLPTLMHDRQYRLAIAWQNVAYNQPPHPGYYLGDGMTTPPPSDMVTSLGALPAAAPAVSSINRFDPFATSTGATSVVFRVTFNAPVTGVDSTDFVLTNTGTVIGTVGAVTPLSALAYNVVVGSITGTGDIRLDLKAAGTGITGPGAAPIAGGFTSGQTYFRATLAWINPVTGGLWSNPANWDGGVIADGVGNVPIFGNFDLTANNTVMLDTPRTISGATFGDTNTATPASWTISDGGDPANILTLDTVSGVPAVTVSALGAGATATLATTLAGTDGFAKAGAGVLVLNQPATITGQVNVPGGTLRIAPGATLTASTVSVSAGGGTLDIAGGAFTATGNTTVNGNGGSLIVNSGTGTFAAVATNNSTNGLIRVNGGSFTASSINLPRSSDSSPSFSFGFVVTGGSAAVSGTVGLGTNNSWGSMSIEGGSASVGGAISVGNQSSGGRGGQMRVTGGTFLSTHADGIILTRANNNQGNASFLGGTSTVEKFTFGFTSGVTGGSATLTVNGGTLYLGSGGMLRNGTGTFTSTINLTNGVLGAKANWAAPTTLPMILSTGGNITFKAANAADTPFNITLNGILSGAGGFTKTGAGILALNAANTFTGPVVINGGLLQLSGSLAAGAPIEINAGGSLVGDGTANRVINLNGTIDPSGASPTPAFKGETVTWNSGGRIAFDLGGPGASSQVILTGALTKGTAGVYEIALNAGSGFAVGNTYTVATFGSTNFSAADFTATGLPPGYAAEVSLTATSLQLKIVGTPFITSAATASGTYGTPFSYTITAGNEPTSYSALGLPAGLSIDPVTGIISGTPEVSGTFNVTLGATNIAGTGNLALTLTIEKAAATITLSNLKQAYDGTPKSATATTDPAGLTVLFTYNGSATPPTLPGSYAVVATIDDPNYQGSTTGTLVITITALVRHAPTIHSELDGSLQLLTGESFTLNGNAFVSGDVLVPGLPAVQVNGQATLLGIQDSTGSETPAGYVVTLNSKAALRYVVRRVDPIPMPVVNAPAAPAGTRDVTINNASQSIGDPATLRNLTLNRNAGAVAVPAGTYGAFAANSGATFVLGEVGATEPSVYELQSLALNGGSIEVVGPVIVRLANDASFNGATIGSAAHPDWLTLEIASGGLTLNSGATLHGDVVAPNGTVALNKDTTLNGHVAADGLILNGNGSSILADPML